jgi:hypothetical protein
MKTKNVIWGLVLVLIGTLFILKNLDIVYFSWHSIWRLWPVVLVLIGIAILPIKSGIKIALTIITLIIATIILVSFPKFHDWNSWSDNLDRNIESPADTPMIDQKIFEPYNDGITEAEMVFDAAAGNFKIDQSSTELFEFLREGNLGKYNYSMKELGNRRDIRIELDEGRVRNIDLKNNVSLKLNPAPLWDLKIDVGAASIDMDLSEFKIRKLDIDGGASSINIRMGNKQDDGKVMINSGASSITIRVPQDVACEVRVKTVLSSKNLEGFDRVSDGTYVTPGFAESSKNLVIQIEAAVSSLQVERY